MAWEVDLAHSSLEFAVRHMLVSTVKGAFREFSVDAQIEDEDAKQQNALPCGSICRHPFD